MSIVILKSKDTPYVVKKTIIILKIRLLTELIASKTRIWINVLLKDKREVFMFVNSFYTYYINPMPRKFFKY